MDTLNLNTTTPSFFFFFLILQHFKVNNNEDLIYHKVKYLIFDPFSNKNYSLNFCLKLSKISKLTSLISSWVL